MKKDAVDQRKGQMNLSFGMIFGIFLIIIFIAFAFYAIQKFLQLKDTTQIAKFADDLQFDIDRIWKGSQANQARNYILPAGIDLVCLIDYNSGTGNGEIYDELESAFYGSDLWAGDSHHGAHRARCALAGDQLLSISKACSVHHSRHFLQRTRM